MDRPFRPGSPRDGEDVGDRFDPSLGPRPPRGPQDGRGLRESRDAELARLLREDEDLERQTRELAQQYQETSSEKRDAIQHELQRLVTRHFEIRQERRSLELKHLEEEVQHLRQANERRVQARDQIIEKRVSQLLGENDLEF